MTAAMPGAPCAEAARALDEPMAGTAPTARRWLCLERPEAWPSDINQERDPAVRALLARAAAVGFRPLMIRPSEPALERRVRRIFLSDTIPGRAVTTTLTIERLEQLHDLPLPDTHRSLPGEPVTMPLLLVCTHEQRDLCCGLDGKALVEALAAPNVFACSHLGGHRFAPTAMVLPTGYLYGRLEPTSAAAIHTEAAGNEVATDRCRGRCTWSPRGQVADLAVRASTGMRSPDALVVQDDTGDTVVLGSATGERWAVDLEVVDVDASRPASCGARPTLIVPLRAVTVRPLPADSSR
jgi:hypothetical protein